MEKAKGTNMMEMKKGKFKARIFVFAFCLFTFAFASACRYDMQDQPRYKAFTAKAKIFSATARRCAICPKARSPAVNCAKIKRSTRAKRKILIRISRLKRRRTHRATLWFRVFRTTLRNFPCRLQKNSLTADKHRYNVFCIVCHGPVGNGDGMIVRRGYPQPPTYHDDRLRNAPVGHFFDVMTNGWGKMSSYASQIPAADRWAIVAYIRALQISQNPSENLPMTSNTNSANTNSSNTNTAAMPQNATNANTQGGNR